MMLHPYLVETPSGQPGCSSKVSVSEARDRHCRRNGAKRIEPPDLSQAAQVPSLVKYLIIYTSVGYGYGML